MAILPKLHHRRPVYNRSGEDIIAKSQEVRLRAAFRGRCHIGRSSRLAPPGATPYRSIGCINGQHRYLTKHSVESVTSRVFRDYMGSMTKSSSILSILRRKFGEGRQAIERWEHKLKRRQGFGSTWWQSALAPRRKKSVTLSPIECEEIGSAIFTSPTSRPWLQIKFADGLPAGRWTSIWYSASLYDGLSRPIIRFRTPNGNLTALLPAALFGRGAWTGYVPPDTTQVDISPVEQHGRFGFRVDAYSTSSVVRIAAMALVRHPWRTLIAGLTAATGSTGKAYELVQYSIRSCDFHSYHTWKLRGIRELELDGIDRPRNDWREGPHIRAIVQVDNETSDASLAATLISVRDQAYLNWSLVIVSPTNHWMAVTDNLLAPLRRQAIHVPPGAPAETLWSGFGDNTLLVPLMAGATIPRIGLAALAEYSIANPQHEIIYADEDEVDHQSRFCNPKLKPDWSPIFQCHARYVGRAIYIRAAAVKNVDGALAADLTSASGLIEGLLASNKGVGHLRRVLLTSPQGNSDNTHLGSIGDADASARQEATQKLTATIIILSKDRADLLGACLDSLECTQPQNFEIIVMDNGSKEPTTFALYDRWRRNPRVRIQYCPGPFNFSALCNSAVAMANAPIVVFLNNDTIVRSSDWLEQMISYASHPRIGATGTRLVYPSGRIQHAGLIIGLGGLAAHIERDAQPSQPGYLQGLVASREVSAVTAACMAIDKAKFSSVGGFDSAAFPVELNDVDLCLRLNAAGWKTVCLTKPVLIHHESATRGRTLHQDARYAHERDQFRERWLSHIRDDPYFHPALSLHSVATALDQ